MPGYNVEGPGAAFSNSLEHYMTVQAVAKHQAELAKIALKREERVAKEHEQEMKMREMEMKDRQDARKESTESKAYERKKANVVSTTASMVKGDIPASDYLKDLEDISPGAAAQLFPAAPQSLPGIAAMPLGRTPGVMPSGPAPPISNEDASVRPFVGTPVQREAESKRGRQQAYLASQPPGSPQRQAGEFQLGMEDSTPPTWLGKPTSEPVEVFVDPVARKMWANDKDGKLNEITQAPPGAHYNVIPQPAQHAGTDTKGWSVQKLTDAKTGQDVLARVNAITGESHPITNFLPQAPAAQRGRAWSAGQVLSHFDTVKKEIAEADKRGLLGPLAGRGTEFLAGKIGTTGNPENDKLLNSLRMDLLLVKSGTTMVHFGARGGQTYIDKMNGVLDSGKMTKDELFGALDAAGGWLKTYSKDPRVMDPNEPSATTTDTSAPVAPKLSPAEAWKKYGVK